MGEAYCVEWDVKLYYTILINACVGPSSLKKMSSLPLILISDAILSVSLSLFPSFTPPLSRSHPSSPSPCSFSLVHSHPLLP